jgi:hypothetical protein
VALPPCAWRFLVDGELGEGQPQLHTPATTAVAACARSSGESTGPARRKSSNWRSCGVSGLGSASGTIWTSASSIAGTVAEDLSVARGHCGTLAQVSALPRKADAAEHAPWSGGSSSSLKLPQGAARNRRSLASLTRNWPVSSSGRNERVRGINLRLRCDARLLQMRS